MTHNYKVKQLVLQPTPYCNLDCKYCYLPERKNRSRMDPLLPADAIQYLADSNLASPGIQVIWHAGEPLAAGLPFYQKALQNIKERNFPYHLIQSLQTNGTLITDEWCQFFKEHKVTVGVSIDGPQHIHDQNRVFHSGKGSFDLCMKGVSLLKKHEISFTVIAVISSHSIQYPDLIYDFFSNLGVRRLGLNIEEEEGINRSKTLRETDFLESYFRFFKRLDERSLDGKLEIREASYMTQALYSERHPIENTQGKPFHILSVDYQGNFSTFSPELLGMSHKDYDSFTLGNIYKDSFDSVLRSNKFQKLSSSIEKGIQNCKDSCPYFFLCGGGAPTNKLYENGSFESTETFYCKANIQIPLEVVLPRLEAASKTFSP